MNESVVKCRFDVAHTKDVLLVFVVLVDLRGSVVPNLLLLGLRLGSLLGF